MIPVLKINNRKEKKEVSIDGVQTVVDVPAAKQFTLFKNNGEGLEVEKYGDKLVGTILAVRFAIKSKHGILPKYQSTEFDYTDGGKKLTVFSEGENGSTKAFDGTIEQAREAFSTGEKNKFGKDMTTYDTFCHVYLLDQKDNDTNRSIVKFKWKLSKNCNIFDYLKSFDGETPSGRKTIFELYQETVGENTFWAARAIQGEPEEDITKIAEKIEELKSLIIKKPKQTEPEPEREIPVDDIPF